MVLNNQRVWSIAISQRPNDTSSLVRGNLPNMALSLVRNLLWTTVFHTWCVCIYIYTRYKCTHTHTLKSCSCGATYEIRKILPWVYQWTNSYYPVGSCLIHNPSIYPGLPLRQVKRCKLTGQSPSLHRAMFRWWKAGPATQIFMA